MIVEINDFRTYLKLSDADWLATKPIIELLQPSVEAAVNRYVGYNIANLTHTEFLPAGQDALNFWDANILNFRHPMLANIDGRRSYRNQQMLWLSHVPVRSITSIHILNTSVDAAPPDFTNATLLTYGSDYRLAYTDNDASLGSYSDTGLVIRETGNWPRRLNSTKIVYVSGFTRDEIQGTKYAVIPLCIMQTVAFVLAESKQIQGTGNIASESLAGQYSVAYQLPQQLLGGIHSLPPSVKRMLASVMHMGDKI